MPDEEKEEFADTEILPENVDKLIPDKNIKDENTKNTKNTKNNNELILKGNTILDDIQVSEIDIQDTKELREIIDKNSSEIADLKKRNKENFVILSNHLNLNKKILIKYNKEYTMCFSFIFDFPSFLNSNFTGTS